MNRVSPALSMSAAFCNPKKRYAARHLAVPHLQVNIAWRMKTDHLHAAFKHSKSSLVFLKTPDVLMVSHRQNR